MAYNFLKPKTINVSQATWDIVKTKWYFWAPFLFIFIFGVFGIFALVVPFLYFVSVSIKVQSSFWKEFAIANGWQYKDTTLLELYNKSLEKEMGIMFKEGNTRNISNEITGTIKNRHFRIFCYGFTVGSGKNSRTYNYTVFAFKSIGIFPHIYLNNKSNSWNIDVGENIPLPKEFENKFSISTPQKYETEALEIFTPDILASLLQNNFLYDVEFVNQEILVFADGQINNFDQLEKRFNDALTLNDLLAQKLDKFKFEKIGDLPSTL